MRHPFRLFTVAVLLAGVTLAALPRPAAAHPMGNFTINHYSALTVGARRVDLLYVIDMAEIPAYQELGGIRPDHNTDLTAAQRDSYLSGKAKELAGGLRLTVDGTAVPLTPSGTPTLAFPPGAGGAATPTLRMELHYTAALPSDHGSLTYSDTNYAERIGWREIIAQSGDNTALQASSVPAQDVSNALTEYRPELLNNPPVVSSATLTFVAAPGAKGSAGDTQQAQAAARGISSTNTWAGQANSAVSALTDLLNRKELPLEALLFGLLLAFGAGAAHALSPGHGKTVVAAYLVGSRGTGWHAVILGLTVTISHTIGVFALGLIVLYASEYILPEQIYPWLGASSGLLIAGMGIVMFWQRRKTWRQHGSAAATAPLAHDHTDLHDPTVPHSHGAFSRPHTHAPADGQKVGIGNLLSLGIMGGIIPCPSALIVLLGAVAYHKVGLGLLLILAFSLGLAAVLTGIGLMMVYGRGLAGRVKFNLSQSLLGRLPMASALAVSCLGLIIVYQSLHAGITR
ncbi:MAG: hypothetical protein M3Z04_19700 [Chloroflexota bacterium]|nr:hypothetical protein [Chloroflexota bacterium]